MNALGAETLVPSGDSIFEEIAVELGFSDMRRTRAALWVDCNKDG